MLATVGTCAARCARAAFRASGEERSSESDVPEAYRQPAGSGMRPQNEHCPAALTTPPLPPPHLAVCRDNAKLDRRVALDPQLPAQNRLLRSGLVREEQLGAHAHQAHALNRDRATICSGEAARGYRRRGGNRWCCWGEASERRCGTLTGSPLRQARLKCSRGVRLSRPTPTSRTCAKLEAEAALLAKGAVKPDARRLLQVQALAPAAVPAAITRTHTHPTKSSGGGENTRSGAKASGCPSTGRAPARVPWPAVAGGKVLATPARGRMHMHVAQAAPLGAPAPQCALVGTGPLSGGSAARPRAPAASHG